MHRRTYLRSVAAAGAGAVALGAATTRAAGDFRGQPEAVSITYDAGLLGRHRPLLDLRAVDADLRQSLRLYGWVMRREDRSATALQYIAYYPDQRGVTTADSHVPDREPVVVYIDEQADTVERVEYDAYHYFVGADDVEPRVVDGRPYLRVIAPWHPFRRPDPGASSDAGQVPPLGDLREWYPVWLRDGWAIDPPTATDPWRLRRRGHWWADTSTGIRERIEGQIGLLLADLGLPAPGAAEESDLV